MLSNYFKVARRNISRNKVNAFINIAGLSVGLASVILISWYVQDELEYDTQFKNADLIFQVNLNGNQDGTDFITGNTPPTVGPALVSEIPEIESCVRIHSPGDLVVRAPGNQFENSFTEKNILGVDSNFLQVFDYQMIEGDVNSCLNKPNSVVIPEKIAKKYFGNGEALGKTLLFDNDRTPFTVTGILRDPPDQVTWRFDMLTSISSWPAVKRFSWSWVWLQVNTYVKLKDNVTHDEQAIAMLQKKFPEVVKKHAATAFRRIGQPLDEFYKKGGKWDFQLQLLKDVHLYSAGIGSRISTLSDIKYVYIFSAIALFMIVLACVNFMNISTAQSASRGKEVGIRKVLGSEKQQLVKQFMSEAFLHSFLAMFIALLLAMLFLGPFNVVAGKNLDLTLLVKHFNWLFIIVLTCSTALLAGSYPAFYLTSFKPAEVLRGFKFLGSKPGAQLLRNGLVVFQFAVSTLLISCTLVVYLQLSYMHNKNIGLNKDNVVVISNVQRLGRSEETFRHEIEKLSVTRYVSVTSSQPTHLNFADGYVPEPGAKDAGLAKEISLPSFVVDESFIPVLNIEMLSGRNFSREYNDSSSVILNESAVKQIGWKDPVGMFLQYPGNDQRFRVIGVAKDFNLESLKNKPGPFALFHYTSKTYDLGYACMLARIGSGDVGNTMTQIKNRWKDFSDAPFEYTFLDEDFNALYQSEKRMGEIFTVFTALSVFVGCLGLFGLAAYTAEKRTREIGIRKVAGASVESLVRLLSGDFIKLVLLSSVIAIPVAWYVMHKWLEDFAYRITLHWWIFTASALLSIVIAFLTVSSHAIKAAIANPIRALRTE